MITRRISFSLSVSIDQLLADLQDVSKRARNAYENETRLEPMVLNRNLPVNRTRALNLIRPDSTIEPV